MAKVLQHPADLGTWARLTIDLAALKANFRMLADRVVPAQLAAVVKADAYGLGTARIGPALAATGCSRFFVAHLSETEALHPHLLSCADNFVLNGVPPGTEDRCARQRFVPLLNSLEQVRCWAMATECSDNSAPAAIQVDSGMSRFILSPTAVEVLSEDAGLRDRIALRIVMSHLACADEPEDAANADSWRNS